MHTLLYFVNLTNVFALLQFPITDRSVFTKIDVSPVDDVAIITLIVKVSETDEFWTIKNLKAKACWEYGVSQ